MSHERLESRSFTRDGKAVHAMFITVGPRKGQQVGPFFDTLAKAEAFGAARSRAAGKRRISVNPFKDLTKPK